MNAGMSRRGFLMAAASTAAAGAAKGAVADRSVPQDPQFGAKTGPLGKYVGRLAPGRYDAHTHVYPGDPDPDRLVKSFADAGLVGGVVFSRCPNGWQVPGARLLPPEEAMDNVIAWCSGSPSIYPFYWIDPAADNAVELVDMAVEKGIYGFKVIRGAEMPVDPKALKAYRRMAEKGKPITFHTGILWDGRDSSDYFRPANWEGLLEAPHLRFALAHVSWPWCDECVAVYGKMLNAIVRRGLEVPEMFIDTTPGTPKLYRRDALAKVFTVGYDVSEHVMYGTDCRVDRYNVGWSRDWQRTDDAILSDLGLGADRLDDYYRRGLRRFLFGGDNSNRKVPTPDGRDGNVRR